MNELAISLAGHDKGKLYGIVYEAQDMVCLADGTVRTLERPKKKNRKHIRKIVHLPEAVREALETVSADSDLVHVLRVYQTRIRESQEEKRENEVKREQCPSQM